MALQPGTMLGQYRIRQLIGEGGMGAVYEAIHIDIDRPVAIKVLHPKFATNQDAVRRFFNEARAVNRIEHPSVVQVSEAHHLEDGTAYLVMELLRGESLTERLKRSQGRLALDDLIRIVRQVASALAVTHNKGIVHRDLKPDNIMLVPDAEVTGGVRARLLDFGVAKLMDQGRIAEQGPQVLTHPDAIIGTPLYMSPEQCRGPTGIDEKTDVYALGVILYEALAGRAPFVAETNTAIMAMHVFESPPPLSALAPDAPKVIADLVMRMLSKDKEKRPPMSELATTLADPEVSAIISERAIKVRVGAGSKGVYIGGSPQSGTAHGAMSTLGGTTGQRWGNLNPGRSRFLVALVGCLALLLGGLVYRSLRPGAPRAATAVPPAAIAPVNAPPENEPAPAPLANRAPTPAVPPTVAAPAPTGDAAPAASSKRSHGKGRTTKKEAHKSAAPPEGGAAH